MPFSQRGEVARFVIEDPVLPAAPEDADPFESERAQDGVMGFAGPALAVVVGVGPDAAPDGLTLFPSLEDEPARKVQRFAEMSKGWIIGTPGFTKTMTKENQELVGYGRRMAAELRETREALWREELSSLLSKLGRSPGELARERKSARWKAALAGAMKARTTATNRWLGENLNMGGLHEVSRQVSAWHRQPDPALQKRLGKTTNYKA